MQHGIVSYLGTGSAEPAQRAQVIVATGFIAKNPAGQVTTLRRNGSDYSATIAGALLRSMGIIIWTDVDGVFSADPPQGGLPGLDHKP